MSLHEIEICRDLWEKAERRIRELEARERQVGRVVEAAATVAACQACLKAFAAPSQGHIGELRRAVRELQESGW